MEACILPIKAIMGILLLMMSWQENHGELDFSGFPQLFKLPVHKGSDFGNKRI